MTRFAPLVALLALLGVTACNAVEGAGEDVQAAGNAVEDATDEAVQ